MTTKIINHRRKELKIMISLLCALVGMFAILNDTNTTNNPSNVIDDFNTQQKITLESPLEPQKSSGPIYFATMIDEMGGGNGTWVWANSTQPWCKGNGSYENPYIIANVTFDGRNSSYGLYINASHNVYFMIFNCTFINCISTPGYGGLMFNDVQNGTVYACKFNNNKRHGCVIRNLCTNITLFECTFTNNAYDSFMSNQSTFVNVLYCNFTNSGDNAISVYGYSSTFYIMYNIIQSNTIGIWINNSNSDVIQGNIISSNDYGIYLSNSSTEYCYRNIIVGNDYGIYGEDLHNSELKTNNISLNTAYGVFLDVDSDTNFLFGNLFQSNFFAIFSMGSLSYGFNLVDNELDSALIIDELGGGDFTWAQAEDQLYWFEGSGTFEEPYLFDSILFDGADSYVPLRIRNSPDAYVRIEECTFTQCPNTLGSLYIYNSSNIIISNNDIIENGRSGIHIDTNCDNITIVKNNIFNNALYGIFLNMHISNINILNNTISINSYGICALNYCQNFSILNNEISYNSDGGMFIAGGCANFSIQNNQIFMNDNTETGIQLYLVCGQIDISKNLIYNQSIGIDLGFATDNINVTENTIQNTTSGIVCEDGTHHNLIRLNNIQLCANGIYLKNTTHNCSIDGNILSSNGIGINLNDNVKTNIIQSNTISSCDQGIRLSNNVNDTQIISNTISSCDQGIELSSNVKYTAIISNTISTSAIGDIIITDCSFTTMNGNLLNGHGLMVVGTGTASNNITSTNLFLNKPIYYYINQTNLNTNGFNNAGQIFLVRCNTATISGITFSQAIVGIMMDQSLSIEISNCVFSNCYCGVSGLFGTNSSFIEGSSFIGCMGGIDLAVNSNNNQILNNYFEGCTYGILFESSATLNLIENNTLYSNEFGIKLDSSSNSNCIRNCDIAGNTQYGIYLGAVTSNLIYDNLIYDNSINAYDLNAANFWNSTFFGNVWGNYYGRDNNDDGIGDQSFVILSGSGTVRDYLPQVFYPQITTPESSYTFEMGNTNKQLSWIIFDPNTHNPTYSIYLDSQAILLNQVFTTNIGYCDISYVLNSITIGSHQVLIEIDDGCGCVSNYVINVDITNAVPMITFVNLPANLTFEIGLATNLLQIQISDPSIYLSIYNIYANDVLIVFNQAWISGSMISFDLNRLGPGNKHLNFEVKDGYGAVEYQSLQVNLVNNIPKIIAKNSQIRVTSSNTNIVISWRVEDSSLLNPTYSIKIDDYYLVQNVGFDASKNITTSLSGLSQGSHTMYIIVNDGYGATAVYTIEITISLPDTTSLILIGVIGLVGVIVGLLIQRRFSKADREYLLQRNSTPSDNPSRSNVNTSANVEHDSYESSRADHKKNIQDIVDDIDNTPIPEKPKVIDDNDPKLKTKIIIPKDDKKSKGFPVPRDLNP